MGNIIESTGQKVSLSLVAGYNQSDSSIGVYHFLEGMTGINPSNLKLI